VAENQSGKIKENAYLYEQTSDQSNSRKQFKSGTKPTTKEQDPAKDNGESSNVHVHSFGDGFLARNPK
jgi:hypothetical protein